MDISKLKKKFSANIGKYKFVFLILCIGLIFILLPTGSAKKKPAADTGQTGERPYISQTDLAAILSKIEGTGRVEVMLSLESTSETDFQLDRDGGTSADRTTTVTVTDSQRNETGLVSKTNAPVYRGAIVVCDGADDPSVHLSVVSAVANITGLRTNQISVLKMD